MSAWVYQDPKQVKKVGDANASWYIGWFDPEGKKRCKSCGPGADGHRLAEKERKKVEAQLITGTYQDSSRKTWEEFRKEYEAKVLDGLAVRSRDEIRFSLNNFERVVRPVKMSAIRTATIDDFVARRRKDPGRKVGDLVSPATINKDLRHLRAALRWAKSRKYIAEVPEFGMVKVYKRLVTFITPEHFAALYQACDAATLPRQQPFPAADWWRALLVTAYMTGWRISELLALGRDDLDLDAGVAITRAEDNKGKRDERVKLHPVVVEHLRKLAGFHPQVFPWPHNEQTLYRQFAQIQEAAGIHLPCTKGHEHTRYCHVYGFHDLRRAFATMNADRLTADALQTLMRHKSYQTTQVYINMARQMDEAVASLHVPDVLKKGAG
jgi:integrase